MVWDTEVNIFFIEFLFIAVHQNGINIKTRSHTENRQRQAARCVREDDLLNDDGTLKPRTAKVFEVIGKELDMTDNAVQRAISRRMAEIFGEENYTVKSSSANKVADTDIDYFYEHIAGTNVQMRVPDNMQNAFQIITEVKNNRTVKKIAPGWTDTLFKTVDKELGSGCVFNFEKATLYDTDNSIEFGTTAKCACGSVLNVNSSNNRTEMQLNFEAGSETHLHTKSRRVTATKAKELFKQLKSDSVHNVYLKQVENLPDDADRLPADFVSQKSLANIKSRHSSCNESAINELRKMKYSAEYGDTIKELQTDPFVVTFWTTQQKFLYSRFAAGYIKISIDATGSVVTNNSLLTDISSSLERKVTLPHVFLYLISLKCEDKSIPVGQMLSAQQDSTRISYFFSRWLEDFKKPSEVVVDDSKAFLKSCAMTFASCSSIKEYIDVCFEKLKGEDVQLPKCFICLDVAHFVKNLHKNKIVKAMAAAPKQFYLSCIGFIMQCEQYSEIREIIKHMVRLANGISGCQSSLETLTELIRNHQTSILQQYNDDEHFEDVESDENICEDLKNATWFDEILNQFQHEGQSDKIEPYFNPKLNTFFKDIFNRLPLWSAVMKPFFKSPYLLATSNDTESRFNLIKGPVFAQQMLPIRPDSFVKTMVAYISSLAKLECIMMKVSLTFYIFQKRIEMHF